MLRKYTAGSRRRGLLLTQKVIMTQKVKNAPRGVFLT